MTSTDRELIQSLVAALPKLRRAVTIKPVEASAVGFVSGGAPSFELVSLSALALLQDMRREAPMHEHAIRSSEEVICRSFVPAVDLVAILRHLGQALDAASEARQSVPAAIEARSAVGTWVRRSALVLREARAPYRLLGPDGSRVLCPVVEQGEEGAYVCSGDLLVYRDDETGVPRSIRCSADVTHDWDSGPGWMRLGALLGVLS